MGNALRTAGSKVGQGINYVGSKVGDIYWFISYRIRSSPIGQGVEKALGIANTIGNTLQGRDSIGNAIKSVGGSPKSVMTTAHDLLSKILT